ncbi:polymer-forming cytoskeletal protein [Arsenophonus sp.]|uniref:bactofilin family protein n=2 Tax=unclassified Arsenophonus TaxID=2627083 RepID=UPI003879A610
MFKKREIESTENKQSTENNLESKSDKKTIICSETCFTGDIVSDADILIDGKYIGNILCKEKTVIVTRTGIVTGSILAKKSIIDGTIDGRVESNLIEIQKNGMIEGEIYSENLSIEDGGFFIGISKKITVDLNTKIPERNNVQEHKKHQKIDVTNAIALKEKKEKIS